MFDRAKRVMLVIAVASTLVGATCDMAETPASRNGNSALDGTSIDGDWLLVAMGPVDAPEPLTPGTSITLDVDGTTFGGKAGCNGYSADIEVDGQALSVGPIIATRMACPEPIMSRVLVFDRV